MPMVIARWDTVGVRTHPGGGAEDRRGASQGLPGHEDVGHVWAQERKLLMADVKINATEVSLHKVQRLAESYYKGGFFCDEAVMCALRDAFELDVPEQAIAMVSGMSVGVGKSGCMCGTANGGIAALGLLYGPHRPDWSH